MAFEMICGHCRGNLLVEHFGVVVACPHCGAHLQVPAPADAAPSTSEPVSSVTEPVPSPALLEVAAETVQVDDAQDLPAAPPTEELRAFTGDESEPPPSVEISVVPSIEVSEAVPETTTTTSDEAPTQATSEGAFSLSTLLAASAADAAPDDPTVTTPSAEPRVPEAITTDTVSTTESSPPAEIAAVAAIPDSSVLHSDTPPAMSDAPTQTDTVPPGLSGLFDSSEVAAPAEAPETPPEPIVEEPSVSSPTSTTASEASTTSEPTELVSSAVSEVTVVPAPSPARTVSKDHITVSKMLFVVLLSYASAMTLGFGWLLYQLRTGGASGGLEALPDPAPLKKTTGFQWYSTTTVLTAGHKLGIGDTQRFGNIKVTVLKVTRGPVEFRHFRDRQETRPPSFPVLKLWLRFENMSSDQEIWPLDDQLLFRRYGDRFDYKSSQFVCRADQMTERKPKIVIAYDHVVGSGWDLVGLPLDKPLAPTESREYFVPTCEHGIEQLTGDLVWRVQIRKGYSSRGNSVTTLFEVHFNSQDIRDETA